MLSFHVNQTLHGMIIVRYLFSWLLIKSADILFVEHSAVKKIWITNDEVTFLDDYMMLLSSNIMQISGNSTKTSKCPKTKQFSPAIN